MKLSEKQQIFTSLVAQLIQWSYATGYGLTFGEAWRPPEMVAIYAKNGKGSSVSVHPDRLAVDFNLFVNGKYRCDTESYRPLGEKWESLNPVCRWGGRFTRADGNHFSMEFQGRA